MSRISGLLGGHSFGMSSLTGSSTAGPWLRGVARITWLCLALLAWEVLARTILSGAHILPAPSSILMRLWDDRGNYPTNIATTGSEAAWGYLWGNLAAISLAIAFVQLPTAERILMRLAVATYCMPVVAIAPILQIVLTGDAPKSTLAALSVFFTTLVGALAGLRSAGSASVELVQAYGGGRWMQLVKVRLPYCLPGLFRALQIAAPAALLGAIIGEFLGGSAGLGIALIDAQESLNVERTWGVALITTCVAGAAYALTGVLAKALTPWAQTVKFDPSDGAQ